MPFIPAAEGARCLSFSGPYLRLLFSQKLLVLPVVHLTSQGGDRRCRGHSVSATVDSVVSAFLLKLDPEARNGMEVPSGQLTLKCLHCKQPAFSRLREAWRTAELVLWVICSDFYDSVMALISLMENLRFWGFCCWLGLFCFYFYESNTCFLLLISSTDCFCAVCLQYFQQRI